MSFALVNTDGEVVGIENIRFDVHPDLRFVEIPQDQDVTREWTYADGAFTPPPARVITAEMVKDEAHRRIVMIIPEWKQRNLTARAAELAEKGRENWSPSELAEWNAGSDVWSRVKAVRVKSNQIEAMSSIPPDYTDDKYWVDDE